MVFFLDDFSYAVPVVDQKVTTFKMEDWKTIMPFLPIPLPVRSEKTISTSLLPKTKPDGDERR
jgi:hypothetical protein